MEIGSNIHEIAEHKGALFSIVILSVCAFFWCLAIGIKFVSTYRVERMTKNPSAVWLILAHVFIIGGVSMLSSPVLLVSPLVYLILSIATLVSINILLACFWRRCIRKKFQVTSDSLPSSAYGESSVKEMSRSQLTSLIKSVAKELEGR